MPHQPTPAVAHRARSRAWRPLLLALLAAALALPLQAVAARGTAASPALDPSAKIAPSLQKKFAADGGAPRDFWVSFDERAENSGAAHIDDWGKRGTAVVDELRATAASSQADAIALLDASGADYTSYWITNAIRVHDGDLALASGLAQDAEVDRVFAPVTYRQPEPVKRELTGARTKAAAQVEWGVSNIKADQVWEKYGVRGDGVVVASIDTGAEFEHPALVGGYRGTNDDGSFTNDYNWLDTSGASDYPTDGHGHGTHTMGTMVGDDGAANRIGVAPGARWIEANGCCASDETLISASQWMLAPTKADGTDPDPTKRPQVVNNSWGSDVPTNDPFLEDIQQAWADAGIFGVWSNGNNGPRCQSSGSPGSRAINYAVGAYDSTSHIADFSSRGAGQDGVVKPDIAAPGALVRSSYLDGQYAQMSGTSMAAPHVSGSVALLLSARPDLIGNVAEIRRLLDETAIDTPDDQCGGTDDDNNVYGEGRLDALALIEAADQGESGSVSGTVTGDGSGVSGAVVELTGPSGTRSARTGADGTFAIESLPVGSYDVRVRAFGYADGTATTEVTTDGTATVDVALDPAVGSTVTGSIVDHDTGNPIAGNVTLVGTRFSARAGADGTFALAHVPGPQTYTVKIDDGGRCARPVLRTLEVAGDTTMPEVSLRRRTDEALSGDGWGGGPYGYSCLLEPVTWIKGSTELEKPGSLDSAEVRLPFSFTYFGKDYGSVFVSPSSVAQVGFWTSPVNNTQYPYDEFHKHTIARGLSVFSGAFDDGTARVLTRTTGTAPNRAFTVEFRDYRLAASPGSRLSFEVTLHENGDIVYAYDGIDQGDLLERGATSHVTMEDHSPDLRAARRSQLEYMIQEPVLESARQIRFELPANGFVTGTVTDRRTGDPVAGANVDLFDQRGSRLMRTFADADGRYRFQLMAGKDYEVGVLARPGWTAPARQPVRVTRDRQQLTLKTVLRSGRIQAPAAVTARKGQRTSLTLKNAGPDALTWNADVRLRAADGAEPGSQLARTVTPYVGTAVEEVDGNYWVGDQVGGRLAEVTASGRPTGATISMGPVTQALGVEAAEIVTPGDLAWVESRHWLCMGFYNATTDIACVDPDEPSEVTVIPTGFSMNLAVQGLGYDEGADRFFVIAGHRNGGWQHQLRTLAGPEHVDPGELLNSCMYARQGQGLAWNPTSHRLWTITRDITLLPLGKGTTVFRSVDPATCAEEPAPLVVDRSSLAVDPAPALDLDDQGNPVVVFWLQRTITTLQGNDPISPRLRWASLSHDSGTLMSKATQKIDLTLDWSRIPASVTELEVRLRGNGGDRSEVTVPVTLRR